MFDLIWLEIANQKYEELENAAKKSLDNRKKNKKAKASPVEGLFKQVDKCLEYLQSNQGTLVFIRTNMILLRIRMILNRRCLKLTHKIKRPELIEFFGVTVLKKIR